MAAIIEPVVLVGAGAGSAAADKEQRNIFDDPVQEESLRESIVDCSTALVSVLAALFKDATTADCTFVVGATLERIPAHRFVVSSWSAPLRRMCWGPFAEAKEREIVLADKDPVIFTQFLNYLYTGQLNIEEDAQHVLPSLLAIAHEFDVQPLVEALLQHMGDSVNEDTVCLLMALATRYDQKELQDKFQKWIFTNGQRVMCGKGILDLPLDVFASLVQADTLAAHEVDIFRAIGRWCYYDDNASDVKSDSPATETKSVPSNRVQHLEPLSRHVRFAQMKLHDIFSVVKPSGVLSKETIMELVDILADPDTVDKKKWNMSLREPPAVSCTATQRFEDNTGIIYFIGTDDGRSLSYSNPSPELISINMSSTAGSARPSIFDRNITGSAVENSYNTEPNPWIEMEFKQHRVRPESIYIAQEIDNYLRNWRIEGSDDGRTYVTLANFVANATLTEAHRADFFAVPSDKFYRRIRLYVTGASHTGQANFDITQLEIFGQVTPLSARDNTIKASLASARASARPATAATATPAVAAGGIDATATPAVPVVRAWWEPPLEIIAAPPAPSSLSSRTSSSTPSTATSSVRRRSRSRSPRRAATTAARAVADEDEGDMGFSLFD